MNYYELLNIARDADSNEVKRAYFSAVKLHSPDSDPERFKAIRTAYETLFDPKKRAQYDTYFVASGGGAIASGIQSELLEARELIRENKYKQAADFLTELSGKNPDSAETKRLLAEVLLYLKKSVTAEKLCMELLEENPSDCDAMVLRAKIAASKGHSTKAEHFFNEATNIAPLKAKPWIEYMYFAMNGREWLVRNILERAIKHDPDIFRDDYFVYLVGAYNCISMGGLFLDENHVTLCYEKFAEFFVNDKTPNEKIYPYLLNIMPEISRKVELVPFVEKILPALENSRQRTKEDDQEFKFTRAAIAVSKLRADGRVNKVLVDLTEFILFEFENKNEQLTMECYIAFNLPDLRPSIIILKNEYPEWFKLNQAFYLDALNEKKIDSFMERHVAILKKLKAATADDDDDDEDDDDDDDYFYDFDEPDEIKTVVRESPKVGRNDPCPCGSGKKYKKCCGG